MKDFSNGNAVKKTRIAIVISSLLLVVALSVFAAVYMLTNTGADEYEFAKEDILRNISSAAENDREYKHTYSYLLDFGINGFDTVKFDTAESFFEKASIYKQKTKLELAIKTAELFLEFYFDEIDQTDKTAMTDSLISCYVEATGDKYAVYRTEKQYEDYNSSMSGSFVGIGIYVRYNKADGTLTVTSVMDDSAALEAGILAGDYIVAVDGKRLEDIGYDALVGAIRGEIGTSVTITVLRGGEYIDLTATRKQITEKTVKYSINEEKIGYIELTGFKENTDEQFIEAIDALEALGALGIVFDLRNNPGGYLTSVVTAIDYLVPKGTRIASYTSVSGEVIYNAENEHFLSVPITVVFNENTASAGELFSAAMRDYAKMGILKCKTVGVNTYSKGVVQNTGTFKDGSSLTLTIGYYNPPCDVNYDGIGVAPDVSVGWSAEGDPQLDAAYAAIKELINQPNK